MPFHSRPRRSGLQIHEYSEQDTASMYVVASVIVTCEPIARKPTEDTKFNQSHSNGVSAVKTIVIRGTCCLSRSCAISVLMFAYLLEFPQHLLMP